jgi:Domain of unknown function (DUF4136)
MRSMTPAILLSALLLGACATPRQLDNDVWTYSQWPADRKPASYAFERLPSQEARPEQQQQLEEAARQALETAGFTPSAEPKDADVSVQVGARLSAVERAIYDDPLYWRGGFSTRWRRGFHSSWGLAYTVPSYAREVALLIRDRKSGQVLYEARASNAGGSNAGTALFSAMFNAAMKDFPHPGLNPRRVTVELEQ